MDSFDVSDMSNALHEVNGNEQTNGHRKVDEEAASLARSKGWTAPEGYDYSKYVTPEAGGELPAAGGEDVAPVELPEWAANAKKYEWSDTYGDIGPENSDLEEMLFRSEYINRTGLKINK